MNQGGGVKGVAGGFRGQARGGQLAQLVVDKGEQVGGGPAVSLLGGFDEEGQIRHERLSVHAVARPVARRRCRA